MPPGVDPHKYTGADVGGEEPVIPAVDPSKYVGGDVGPPPPEEQPWSEGRKAATLTAAGVSAGAGLGLILKGMRHGFPGTGTKSIVLGNVLNRLENAFRAKNSETSLVKELNKYGTFRKQNGPLSFGQWSALHGNADVDKVMMDTLINSGMAPEVAKALHLGKPENKQMISDLYATAMKDKSPMTHTDLLDILQRHRLPMQAALEDSMESFKLDPSKSPKIVNVPIGARKDDWRWEQNRTVPEWLHFGEPQNGLQKAVVPNLETLDRMKRSLWTLAQKRAKTGEGDVGAIHEARRELTDFLDKNGPPEYKTGRLMAQENFETEAARELGEKLHKENPAYIDEVLDSMKPNERLQTTTAAAEQKYGRRLPAGEEGGFHPFLRERIGNFGGTSPLTVGSLISNIPIPIGYPSRRASRIGTSWLLDPSEGAADRARASLQRSWLGTAGVGAGVGGVGGLGIYGGSKLWPEDEPSPLEMFSR